MSKKEHPQKESLASSANKLDPVQAILKDAELALQDKSRKLKDSFLANPALYTSVGAGALLFPLPGLIAAGITAKIISSNTTEKLPKEFQKKKLKISRKKMSKNAALVVYKDAVAKQNAIIKALSDEKDADKERIEYLTTLVARLQEIIEELQSDVQPESE